MDDGQRLAVHADGDQRGAAVEGDLQREAGGEPVDGDADDLLGTVLRPGLPQEVGQQHALPAGVADEVAADLVRHAGQGDDLLDHVAVQQVGEGQLDLVVDHPGDAQRPVVGRDLGHGQGRVDPVEVLVGDDEGRQAVRTQVLRRHRGLDVGKGERRPLGLHRVPGGQPPPEHRAEEGGHRRAPGADQEAPSRHPAVHGRRRRGLLAGGHRPVDQRDQRRGADGRGDERGQERGEHAGLRVPHGGPGAEQAGDGEAHGADPAALQGRRSEPRAQQQGDDHDHRDEERLVARAQLVDARPDHPARQAVDEHVADGGDRRGHVAPQPAHDLGQREAERRTHGPGNGRSPTDVDVRGHPHTHVLRGEGSLDQLQPPA